MRFVCRYAIFEYTRDPCECYVTNENTNTVIELMLNNDE